MKNANINNPGYFKSYSELTSNISDIKVELNDRNLNRIGDVSETELAFLKDKDGPAFEDLRKYPLLGINRVHFSPNEQSKSWIFTGSQSGLCRLLQVPDFKRV